MKKHLAFILITCLFFSACSKEVITPTTANQVTEELQKVIKEYGIERIIAWDDNGGFPTVTPDLGRYWIFSNGFIEVGGYGYESKFTRNLLYLDYYDVLNVLVNDGSNPLALILHFSR